MNPSFSLPTSIAGHTQAILAMKGGGKTYLAMKMAELFYAARLPFVALDPTGVWHGLSVAADG